MKNFWNKSIEFKSLVISSITTGFGFLATMFLFWFHRYDIPLAILLGGMIPILTWLFLFLLKRKGQPHLKLDIVLIYLRLALITSLAILFAVLQFAYSIVIVSPIVLIIAYLAVSLLTLLSFLRKEEENV